MLTSGRSSQTVSRYCVWCLNVCEIKNVSLESVVNYVNVIGGIHLLCYFMVVSSGVWQVMLTL